MEARHPQRPVLPKPLVRSEQGVIEYLLQLTCNGRRSLGLLFLDAHLLKWVRPWRIVRNDAVVMSPARGGLHSAQLLVNCAGRHSLGLRMLTRPRDQLGKWSLEQLTAASAAVGTPVHGSS